jgi:hypothetical protein
VPVGAGLAAAVAPDAAELDAGAAAEVEDDELLQAVMATALALASASHMKWPLFITTPLLVGTAQVL